MDHEPQTGATARPDPRPLWLRALVWCGVAAAGAVSVPMLVAGAVTLGEPSGGFLLCFGLLLAVAAAGGVAREVAERRVVHRPPEPRLEAGPDGEPTLVLPRAVAPTRISSLVLAGFAAVPGLGAVLAAADRSWGWAAVLALLTAYVGHVAAPRQTARMAGGLRLTPTRVIDDYRGIRWEAAWDDVTGVDAHHPMRVLLAVRPDRVPTARRTGPRGRAWNPVVAGNVLRVDTAHLAGGSALLGDLVSRALADPAVRRSLGTSASLPTC